MTGTKAIGVAKAMKDRFPDQIDLELHTTDKRGISRKARPRPGVTPDARSIGPLERPADLT